MNSTSNERSEVLPVSRRRVVISGPGGIWSVVGWRILAAAFALTVWWIVAHTVAVDVIPTPLETANRLGEIVTGGGFLSTVLLTLRRVFSGMVVTVLLALLLGIAMGRSARTNALLDTWVLIGRSMPALVWALVAVMVIGLNGWTPVVAVVLTALPLVVLTIRESAMALDHELFKMARVFRAGRVLQVTRILLPALLPSIVAGTKLGLTLAWQVVVIAELFGLGSGVGYEIHEAFSDFDIETVLAWVLAFSVVMAAIEYGLLGTMQRRLNRWRPADRAG
ncbi:ABC transporter permease [Aeromicrobium sp. CTD01-1L150]|uniref:ABC transporter permease n=1 Tax=Aeromicrobium sp. CTD01-1L150 TaxID=3341830 RepID=UPI0035BEB7D3